MARYIINAGGVVNSVADEAFNVHLDLTRTTAMQRQTMSGGQVIVPDFMPREATPDEVAAWYAAQGLVFDPATGEATPAPAAASAAPAAAKGK